VCDDDVRIQCDDVLGAPFRFIEPTCAQEDPPKRTELGGALADQVDPTAHDVANGALGLGDNGSARDSTESVELGKSPRIALVRFDVRTSDGSQGEGMRQRDVVAVRSNHQRASTNRRYSRRRHAFCHQSLRTRWPLMRARCRRLVRIVCRPEHRRRRHASVARRGRFRNKGPPRHSFVALQQLAAAL